MLGSVLGCGVSDLAFHWNPKMGASIKYLRDLIYMRGTGLRGKPIGGAAPPQQPQPLLVVSESSRFHWKGAAGRLRRAERIKAAEKRVFEREASQCEV